MALRAALLVLVALLAQVPKTAEEFSAAMKAADEAGKVRLLGQVAATRQKQAAAWVAEYLDSDSYAVQDAVAEAMKALTGWPYRSVEEWRIFWKRFGAGWSADPGRPSYPERESWWDPVHRFALERPDRSWTFRASEQGYTLQVVNYGAGGRQSWLLVDCAIMTEPTSPARRVAEFRARKKKEWEEYVGKAEGADEAKRSETTEEIGGEEALVLKAVGLRLSGPVQWTVTWRLLVHGDTTVNLFSMLPFSTPAAPLERMIDSFHFAEEDESRLPQSIGHFKAEMGRTDSAGRVALLKRISRTRLPYVSKAISAYLGDGDPAVQAAAIEAAARLRDPRLLSRLLGLAKKLEEHPDRLAALVTAVGSYGSPKARKTLAGLAADWRGKDPAVYTAAVAALGRIPDRAVLGDLIELLEGAEAAVDEAPVLAALAELTGWDYDSPEEWAAYRWKPGERRPPLAELETWDDPVHDFALTRPDETWRFGPGSENEGRQLAFLGKYHRDRVLAWVRLSRADPADAGEGYLEECLDTWDALDEEGVVRKPDRLAGKQGFTVSFSGTDPEGRPGDVVSTLVLGGKENYVLTAWTWVGAPDGTREEIEKVRASLSLGK